MICSIRSTVAAATLSLILATSAFAAVFFAIGSIVLIQQILMTYGYNLAPLQLALWAIPSAIAAFLIHSVRLLMLDRKLGSRGR